MQGVPPPEGAQPPAAVRGDNQLPEAAPASDASDADFAPSAAPSAAPKVEGSPTAALPEESAGYPPKPPRDEDSPPTSVDPYPTETDASFEL